MRRICLFTILAAYVLLTGCGTGSGSATQAGPAVQAVENYYQSIINRDEARLAGSTCAEFEELALVEFDSFQGVESTLEGFACRETGQEGDLTLVQCDGKISASYGNEVLEFPLSDRVHQVRNESGDWRICGYE